MNLSCVFHPPRDSTIKLLICIFSTTFRHMSSKPRRGYASYRASLPATLDFSADIQRCIAGLPAISPVQHECRFEWGGEGEGGVELVFCMN